MGLPTRVDDWTPILVLTAAGIWSTAFMWTGMIGLVRRVWRSDPLCTP
jgi:hypothetical protein